MMDDEHLPRERALAEVKELNRRYLLLVRALYDVSPAEAAARTGLPQAICEKIAGLTTEQIDLLASPDVVSIRDRLGAKYWEKAIQDLQDGRRLALRQAQAVLVSSTGDRR
ncbi:transcriptional activator (FlhD) [Thiohalospira halophila DSM 15071]|uniref:Transcriptional activator (FlhD) n=1 Tax=Thiohalospira halophila DSM 15071 TaxID=1123397 RepID=A0A1I1MY32_9GAMM|nr:flagellar transcriptional regulator FlhD [Thiohalospira halophila]SFC90364.1 transcriptional activator (FlhD) [Thiohalospira halophila DSM 15071]